MAKNERTRKKRGIHSKKQSVRVASSAATAAGSGLFWRWSAFQVPNLAAVPPVVVTRKQKMDMGSVQMG
ncbi:hypothetical protein Ddc_07819 [Ditylenchus destructor]|nr:hypothetical protein Ddc_07819 [Ditylenchus destructor]